MSNGPKNTPCPACGCDGGNRTMICNALHAQQVVAAVAEWKQEAEELAANAARWMVDANAERKEVLALRARLDCAERGREAFKLECADFASEARSLRVRLEEARAKIHDLASEAAELRGCLSQAEVPLSIAQEERDAAHARVAEVERERDEARKTLDGVMVLNEEQYVRALGAIAAAYRTALAYEVEP